MPRTSWHTSGGTNGHFRDDHIRAEHSDARSQYIDPRGAGRPDILRELATAGLIGIIFRPFTTLMYVLL